MSEKPTVWRRAIDLIAFLAVLVTGVLFVKAGVTANSLATVCIALGGLYAAWQASSTKRRGRRNDTVD